MTTLPTPTPDLLQVQGLSVRYGRREVVSDVSFSVREGEIVTILGHNGAGKTTTLKAVFGFLRPSAGQVVLQGRDLTRASCAHKVKAGMCFIPAERFVFADLSVLDNLRLGWHRTSKRSLDDHLAEVYGIFPVLNDRRTQVAGTMSGGQQRMLSVGVALMAEPKLILLDEPSLGLAPAMVQIVNESLRKLVDAGSVSVVLLEQNVAQALRIADRAYVMRSGRIILEEPADEMLARGQWWDLF